MEIVMYPYSNSTLSLSRLSLEKFVGCLQTASRNTHQALRIIHASSGMSKVFQSSLLFGCLNHYFSILSQTSSQNGSDDGHILRSISLDITQQPNDHLGPLSNVRYCFYAQLYQVDTAFRFQITKQSHRELFARKSPIGLLRLG